MSKGQWPRCPKTGIPLKTLARVSERYLTDEGNFRIDSLPDCNLFDARSISAACGFRDHNYFRRTILTHPNNPIHVRRMTLIDEETGVKLVEIIGEAAYGVTTECRDLHPAIPWMDIIGMRHRLIHAYFDVNLDIVWATVTDDLPPLATALEEILQIR